MVLAIYRQMEGNPMEHAKILAIVARLIFVAESDGMACRVDSVIFPPWTDRGAIVDCVGKGRFRSFRVSPSGTVLTRAGRVS